MASMTCRHFHEELERYLDGDRSPAASAHLKSCAACSSIIADLKAIETEAHSWSAPLPEPPERVWVSLRNQLESEGIIKTATPRNRSCRIRHRLVVSPFRLGSPSGPRRRLSGCPSGFFVRCQRAESLHRRKLAQTRPNRAVAHQRATDLCRNQEHRRSACLQLGSSGFSGSEPHHH